MKIVNHSMAAVSVSEDGGTPSPLPASAVLKTTARKVTIEIHHLPCKIEVEEGH